MREKLLPWIPALFFATLAVITTVGNLMAYRSGGSDSAVTSVFLLFLPMCFLFVGFHLTQLRKENSEMRSRLDEFENSESTA